MIDAKVYINVQGDEPLLNPDDLKLLIESSEEYPDIILMGIVKLMTTLNISLKIYQK